MCVYVELSILHQETAAQQFAERSEFDKFLDRVSNFRRHRKVVYCLIGQGAFNLSPLPWLAWGPPAVRLEIDYSFCNSPKEIWCISS